MPLLVAAGLAHAVGLGEVTQQSALGSALRIVVPIIIGPGEEMAGECLRLVPSARGGDGIPEVTTARIAFERTAGGARAVVSSSRAVVDPVLRLTLQAGCDSAVRREYTLLMDPPVIGAPVVATPAAEAPAPRVLTAPSAAPAAVSGSSATGAGRGTAATAPKARPAPRRRAATAPIAVAAPAAAATTAPAPAPKADAAPARRGPAPATTARTPAPAAATAAQPKLTVSSAAPAGAARAPDKGQAVVPGERAPAGHAGSPTADATAALDAEAAALQQRVVELTALVDKMQAEMKEAESKQAAQAARLAADKAAREAPMAVMGRWWGENWPFLAAIVGIAVLIAALLLARRRRTAASGAAWAARPANAARATGIPAPGRGPASGIGVAALKAAEAVGAKLHSTFGQTPAARPTEVDVSELSHVTEEAGVYLAFDRPDRAIDVLREHIKTKPNSLPAAWLMLLDLYHDQKRQQDFRELADEFHAKFNAQTPAWEAYKQRAEGDRGLEDFPHIIRQLIVLWGRPECREFLDHLLHENRDGRRGGFSLATYEDILFLRQLADTLGADSDAARRKRATAAAAPAAGPAAAPKRRPTLDLELALDEDMLKSGKNPPGTPPAKQ